MKLFVILDAQGRVEKLPQMPKGVYLAQIDVNELAFDRAEAGMYARKLAKALLEALPHDRQLLREAMVG